MLSQLYHMNFMFAYSGARGSFSGLCALVPAVYYRDIFNLASKKIPNAPAPTSSALPLHFPRYTVTLYLSRDDRSIFEGRHAQDE